MSIAVDQGALDALAENRQLIRADGGQVILTAKAADALGRAVVNNAGIIEAATLSNADGVIRLEGGTVTISGSLRADGNGARGGRVQILARDDVTLDAPSVISANGTSGGNVSIQAKTGTLLVDGRIEARGTDISGGTPTCWAIASGSLARPQSTYPAGPAAALCSSAATIRAATRISATRRRSMSDLKQL